MRQVVSSSSYGLNVQSAKLFHHRHQPPKLPFLAFFLCVVCICIRYSLLSVDDVFEADADAEECEG